MLQIVFSAKVQHGRAPLQLKCRQLQPVRLCGNLIWREHYLGLRTGPGHGDHTSYLLHVVGKA